MNKPLLSQEIAYPFDTAPAAGEAREVAPGILWARLPLPMALDHVNIYALDEGDSWTIVDTGLHTRASRAAWDGLLDGPLAGKPVARVVLTHHHPDHIGMAGWLVERFQAEVWTTRTAFQVGRALCLDAQPALTAEAEAFYRRAGMDPAILEQRRTTRPFNFADVVYAPLERFHRLSQGQLFHAAGRDWRVEIGHGHAPAHATLWSEDDALILSGDQILPGISPNLGVYPSEPEADPVGEWLESCERLLARTRGEPLVLPGHKLPFTGVHPRLAQLIDNHHGALARLVEHLATPRTGGACFKPLFKRDIGESEYGLALAETLGHLNHLVRTGKAIRTLGEDGAHRWRRA
ncbi:MBL fold metallo-hydrolase [Oceanibium sediminis]|uniref:MBL fold metallo-hydrolase n=1 Tax=Oceanibium sediminis TaxID=2026339 RepID=UPI001E3F8C6D|nr:MBL fold metallo-hydrolase [Oceanibium sediminis]